MKLLLLTLFVVFTMACGADVAGAGAQAIGGSPPTFTGRLWSRAVRRVVIEVDYGPNATPYTGAVPVIGDVWTVFRANATRLFQGTGKELVIPTTVAQMERVAVTAREFTVPDLVALSRQNLDAQPTPDTVVFHVLVLDGWFRDATGRRTDLLGGHLDNTGVIVLFRPVIDSTGNRPKVAVWLTPSPPWQTRPRRSPCHDRFPPLSPARFVSPAGPLPMRA